MKGGSMAGKCIGLDPDFIKDLGGVIQKNDCIKNGGVWVEDGSEDPAGKKNGNCFVRDILTRSLGETILELGGTFRIAQDFRDQILAPTQIGKSFLDRYYANLNQTFLIARQNYALIGSFVEFWITLQPWVRGMLEANGSGEWKGKREYSGHVHFSAVLHERCVDFLGEFKKFAPNAKYARLVDALIAEANLYRGKTPDEALQILRRDVAGPKKSTRKPKS
jgi:hypothetical protein